MKKGKKIFTWIFVITGLSIVGVIFAENDQISSLAEMILMMIGCVNFELAIFLNVKYPIDES